ncbi:MAG: hypothetical protein EU542_06870, partial [Promethearchaeota archaeon]
MAKMEQEIKDIKKAIGNLTSKIGQLQFHLVQVLNKINEGGLGEGESSGAPAQTAAPVSVDITPLEERLEQLSQKMVSKDDLAPILKQLQELRDERMREAEETVDNVTVLLEKGL